MILLLCATTKFTLSCGLLLLLAQPASTFLGELFAKVGQEGLEGFGKNNPDLLKAGLESAAEKLSAGLVTSMTTLAVGYCVGLIAVGLGIGGGTGIIGIALICSGEHGVDNLVRLANLLTFDPIAWVAAVPHGLADACGAVLRKLASGLAVAGVALSRRHDQRAEQRE